MGRRPFDESFRFAWAGLRWAWQTQGNIRRHTLAAVLALVMAHVLELGPAERALLVLTIAVVITAELMNTAVEAVIDLCKPRYHPLAKRAKDVAAAAVLVAAMAAVAVGVFIFGPPLLNCLARR